MKASPIDKLPNNRAFLHFEAVRTSPENVQVDYEMVLPLGNVDCRGTFDHKGRKSRPVSHRIVWLDQNNNRHIPLGRTKVGTSNQDYPFFRGKPLEEFIDLPFRDGAHCLWDNEKLGNLEVFYSMGPRVWKLTNDNP